MRAAPRAPAAILAIVRALLIGTMIGVAAAACSGAPAPSVPPAAVGTAAASVTRAPVPSAYVPSGFIGMPKAPSAFDHAVVDDRARLLFLADRSNSGVDVFALQNETFLVTIGGFAGTRGPNGLAVVADRGEVWAADGDSSVKVIDVAKRSVVSSIKTGGRGRSDNVAYDEKDRIVAVVNDSEPTPFLTFISAADRRILGRLELPGAEGLEEVQWSADRDLFYQTVPATPKNRGGEIDVIDPVRMALTAVLPLSECEPHALALGPGGQILVGCGAARTQLIDGVSGTLLATIIEIGGADDVSFNPTAGHYVVAGTAAGTGGTRVSGPAIGIIDAATGRWMQNVATAPGAHIAVADPTSNHIYVPIPSQGVTVIGAGYGVTNVDR